MGPAAAPSALTVTGRLSTPHLMVMCHVPYKVLELCGEFIGEIGFQLMRLRIALLLSCPSLTTVWVCQYASMPYHHVLTPNVTCRRLRHGKMYRTTPQSAPPRATIPRGTSCALSYKPPTDRSLTISMARYWTARCLSGLVSFRLVL
jgi:hypothetical protein